MKRNISLGVAGLALAVVPTVALAATIGYNLRLTVAVHCTVRHQPGIATIPTGGAVPLGTFREYCNAPGGYELLVRYSPGTLQGARIFAGNDEIVLDGSGQAVLSRTMGPRIRERAISAIPGEKGFDTNQLELQIIPESGLPPINSIF